MHPNLWLPIGISALSLADNGDPTLVSLEPTKVATAVCSVDSSWTSEVIFYVIVYSVWYKEILQDSRPARADRSNSDQTVPPYHL